MFNPKLLLGLLAGGAGLFALTSSASAKPATQSPSAGSASPGAASGPFPADLLTLMSQALASGDPAKMRAAADKVAARGYPEQAASLRAAADAVSATLNATPPVATVPAGSVPGLTPPTDVAAGNLAGRLVTMLAESPKGQEDKALIGAYQAQEKGRGFYVGNIDSLYGPKTALALAADQKIVPPAPRKWPKNNTQQAITNYKKTIMQYAAADAPRAEEWAAAANAAKL